MKVFKKMGHGGLNGVTGGLNGVPGDIIDCVSRVVLPLLPFVEKSLILFRKSFHSNLRYLSSES